MAGILEALGISPHDIDLLRDRSIPLDRPMPFDPSNQVPGSKPAVRVGDIAGMAMQSAPGVGDAYSALQAIKDLEEERYASSILNGIGALPMVAGTFAGIGAKTADVLKLERANKMAIDGVDPVRIWQETGWTNQFPDGKWRFEVDDSTSSYHPGRVKQGVLPKEQARLQEEYDTFVHAKMLRSFMDADPEVRVGKAKELFRQHFEREPLDGAGLWAKDYSQDEIQAFEDEALKKLQNPRIGAKTRDFLDDAGVLAAYPELAGQNTVIVPDEEMNGVLGSYHENFGTQINASHGYGMESGRSILHHELQHGVQSREGFARGGSVDWGQAIAADSYLPEWALRSEVKELLDLGHSRKQILEMYEGIPERKDIPKYLKELSKGGLFGDMSREEIEKNVQYWRDRKDPEEFYRRLAGEAEARLVQHRLNYTPEQRQQIPPWTEFDVPVEDQTVRYAR